MGHRETEERVAGAAGSGRTDEFATLLRELKDRSGLSYGALAKRLHMSTSTLHRYCNGTAVPNEYAPVERLARVCRASPRELVELHRRWILADAARGRRADQAAAERERATRAGAGGTAAGSPPAGDSSEGAGPAGTAPAAASPLPVDPGSAADPAGRVSAGFLTEPGSAAPPGPAVAPAPGTDSSRTAASYGPGEDGEPHEPREMHETSETREPVVAEVTPGRALPWRRAALLASAAVAAAVAAAVLVVDAPSDGDGNDAPDRRAAGASTTGGTADAKEPAPSPATGGQSRTPSASSSASATGPGRVGSGALQDGGTQRAAKPTGATRAVPLIVGTRPYVYDSPCSQHFLVDSEPEQVGPPANEQNAPRWAAAYGAVSSGEQRVALTVQGTGQATVVLEALHMRVVTKGVPLAWNDYSMGVGCGGGVDTKSFDIDLDNGSPTVTVKGGQRDFPYKVSESDPEVFYVTARTKAHDVRWDLTLDWSSGSRHGTVHIDNNGTPFRTSAGVGRPGYDYPLGGSDWIKRGS
ncbi:helix-turn-helix domain-containing protein [Streptomyces sp. NPDC017179]|uniref:helix-turn-helix domain-containing protein n=1 Tax=Streptomyces sp. NPDC017179 TaxID=3364979 RepID=UPI0037A72206